MVQEEKEMKELIGKPSIQNFFKPRPKKMRVIGGWMQSLATTSAITTFITDDKTIRIIGIVLWSVGQLGDLITKLYSKEIEEDEKNDNLN